MDKPLVTIGVPVFNEVNFIKLSLESLIAQDYPNIEIIISDNASTDGTSEICAKFAKEYAHVQHIKQTENIGAAANFRTIQENTDGKYFIWAAGHDLWSKNLISSCVNALESAPDAVIAYAAVSWVDGMGEEISAKQTGYTDTRGLHVIGRFYSVIWGNMHPILGLIRNEVLSSSKGFQSILGADLVVLAELSLKGDFIHVANTTWFRRDFREKESYKERIERYKSNDYKLLDSKSSKTIPILALPWELVKTVFTSKLPFYQKVLSILVLLPTMFLKFIVSR